MMHHFRRMCIRFNGLVTTHVQETIKLIGVRLWVPEAVRNRSSGIEQIWLRAPDGHRFPLKRIASVSVETGQPQITRDNPKRMIAVVMVAQALSGIAKDLNKMSAGACVKTLTHGGGEARLFKWVAALTGSKNALKGAGFFVGAALLEWIGFRWALAILAGERSHLEVKVRKVV